MPVRVLVTYDLAEADADRLRRVSDSLVVEKAATIEEGAAKAPAAEVIHAGRWSEELWKSAPRLTWVQSGGAGIERFLTPDFVAGPIVLTNARGVYAIPIADHVMAFILHFSRRFGLLLRKQIKHEWTHWGPCEPDELAGRTLGIVGLGAIGTEVARRAKAFGMRVIAVRRQPELPSQFADEVRGAEGLHWLLRE
jgi:phosphoglycerate dehydrogenase-like enzyme